MNKQDKLTSKDLITIAIFSVIFALLVGVTSFIGLIPSVYPFVVGIQMIPGGIVWMYLRAKVPKKGSIIIQSIVIVLVLLLFGSFWPSLLGVIVGGVIAEIITLSRGYRSFAADTIGYAVYTVCLTICANLPPLIAYDYYYTYAVQSGGMDPAYMEQMMAFLTGPVFAISLAVGAAGGIAGAFLGRKVMKKHFERAGIV